jgi:hypothetical protein
MLIRIDVGDARPLYEQIVLQLRAAITDGSLAGGDRLPPAKELAWVLARLTGPLPGWFPSLEGMKWR